MYILRCSLLSIDCNYREWCFISELDAYCFTLRPKGLISHSSNSSLHLGQLVMTKSKSSLVLEIKIIILTTDKSHTVSDAAC